MSIVDKATLKTYFDDGSRPTGNNFADLIDSLGHIDTGFATGGNSFGANASLGTNDPYSLQLKTNNQTRVSIDSAGITSFSASFAASSGSSAFSVLNIIPSYNQTGTANGIIRGIYYNPTITSVLGAHYAFESTSGDLLVGGNGNITAINHLVFGSANDVALIRTGANRLELRNNKTGVGQFADLYLRSLHIQGGTQANVRGDISNVNMAFDAGVPSANATNFRFGTGTGNTNTSSIVQIVSVGGNFGTTINSSGELIGAGFGTQYNIIGGPFTGKLTAVKISPWFNITSGSTQNLILDVGVNSSAYVQGSHTSYFKIDRLGSASFSGPASSITNFSLTNGVTSNADNTITYDTNTVIKAGDSISGTNIPVGTYVTGIVSSTSAKISQAATASGSAITFTITPVTFGISATHSQTGVINQTSAGLYINNSWSNASAYNRALLINYSGSTSGFASAVEITNSISEHAIRLSQSSTTNRYAFGIGNNGLITSGEFFFSRNEVAVYQINALSFIIRPQFGLVGGNTSTPFKIGGGIGGNNSGSSIILASTAAQAQGNYTPTSGTINVVQIAGAPGSFSGQAFAPTSGNANFNAVLIDSIINQSGTATGTIKGIYYNPTVSSVLGTHYAWESTNGDMLVGGTGCYRLNESGTAKKVISLGTNVNNVAIGEGFGGVQLKTTGGIYLAWSGNNLSMLNNGVSVTPINIITGAITFPSSNLNFTATLSSSYTASNYHWIQNSITLNNSAASNIHVFSSVPTINNTSTGYTALFNADPTITAYSGSVYGYRSNIASGTNRWNIYASGTASNYFGGDIVNKDTNAIYLGDPDTDGTYRIKRDGNNLITERRESGTYVVKQTITA